MKNLFIKTLCLALCMFALACGAVLAEPVFTVGDVSDLNGEGEYVGSITDIEMDTAAETLIIPGTIKVEGTDVDIVGIDVDFSKYTELKYVRVDIVDFEALKNGSLDFSSAENLEYIFVNFALSDIVNKKFDVGSRDKILQYLNLSGESIAGASITYENGMVTLDFDNIISYPEAYSYHVIRTEKGSGTSVSFDSASSVSVNFSLNTDGTVTFIDYDSYNPVKPGKEYLYSIVAMEPFGSSSFPLEMSISIPADVSDKTPDKPSAPETGDGMNLVLWAALAIMSITGMMIAIRKKEA